MSSCSYCRRDSVDYEKCPQFAFDIPIPPGNRNIARFIGTRGANINSLRDQFNCLINIRKNNGAVVVSHATGNKNLDELKRRIMQCLELPMEHDRNNNQRPLASELQPIQQQEEENWDVDDSKGVASALAADVSHKPSAQATKAQLDFHNRNRDFSQSPTRRSAMPSFAVVEQPSYFDSLPSPLPMKEEVVGALGFSGTAGAGWTLTATGEAVRRLVAPPREFNPPALVQQSGVVAQAQAQPTKSLGGIGRGMMRPATQGGSIVGIAQSALSSLQLHSPARDAFHPRNNKLSTSSEANFHPHPTNYSPMKNLNGVASASGASVGGGGPYQSQSAYVSAVGTFGFDQNDSGWAVKQIPATVSPAPFFNGGAAGFDTGASVTGPKQTSTRRNDAMNDAGNEDDSGWALDDHKPPTATTSGSNVNHAHASAFNGFTSRNAVTTTNNDTSSHYRATNHSANSAVIPPTSGNKYSASRNADTQATLPTRANATATNENTGTEPKKFGGFAQIRAAMANYDPGARWKDYPVLQKDFYEEHPEVTQMTDKQVAGFLVCALVLRLENNNIAAYDQSELNRRPPKPCPEFKHAFAKFPDVLDQLRAQNFEKPTPIQSQVWPIALKGHNVTGTGKTLAFLLPAFIHIDHVSSSLRKLPTCLVLAPTRELAMQIESEVRKYSYRGIKSVCVYGGGSRKDQVDICAQGVDIIIAVPGRLNDLVMSKVIDLKNVSFVVFDEADRMLDMGFEPQILKIMLDVRPDCQMIMTSATWPEGVQRLGLKYAKDPFLVFVGTLDLAACQSVTQKIVVKAEEEKKDYVFNFLKNLAPTDKVIVFVGRKALADDLASDFAVKRINCISMHGSMDQRSREDALADLKRGEVQVLITTDLCARGLDVADITHVLNYDFPRDINEYVHRVGRTGRAGRTGTSITLMTYYDKHQAPALIKILNDAGQEVPPDLRTLAAEHARRGGRPPFRGNQNRWRSEQQGDTSLLDAAGNVDPFAGFSKNRDGGGRSSGRGGGGGSRFFF